MSTLSRATGTTRKRNPRDYYPTIDPRAAAVLMRHLGGPVVYAEPCAGAGDLIDLLQPFGNECLWAADLLPMRRTVHSTGQQIAQQDALTLGKCGIYGARLFITNLPWDRDMMHALITQLVPLAL